MKKGIHPEYHPVVFEDAGTGKKFLTRSTVTSDRSIAWTDGNSYPLIVVDVTSDSHPFWTGANRVLDAQGRVEKFERRYGKRTRTPAGSATSIPAGSAISAPAGSAASSPAATTKEA